MGLFDRFRKKEAGISEDVIAAMADGELIDVATVSDPVFAQKMMGESIAFRYEGDTVTVCAPAAGTLSVMFPTGHAFGRVAAGDPVVEADLKQLSKEYDMSTMLIVTNANGKDISFISPQHVSKGMSVIR